MNFLAAIAVICGAMLLITLHSAVGIIAMALGIMLIRFVVENFGTIAIVGGIAALFTFLNNRG